MQKLIDKEEEHANLGAAHINPFRVFWLLCEPEMTENVDMVEQLLRQRHGLDAEGPAGKKHKVGKEAGAASASTAASSSTAVTKQDLLRMKVMASF